MTDKITEAFNDGRALGHAEIIAKTRDTGREMRSMAETWREQGKPSCFWAAMDEAASALLGHAEVMQNWSRKVAGNRQDARDVTEGTQAGSGAISRAGGAFAGDGR